MTILDQADNVIDILANVNVCLASLESDKTQRITDQNMIYEGLGCTADWRYTKQNRPRATLGYKDLINMKTFLEEALQLGIVQYCSFSTSRKQRYLRIQATDGGKACVVVYDTNKIDAVCRCNWAGNEEDFSKWRYYDLCWQYNQHA